MITTVKSLLMTFFWGNSIVSKSTLHRKAANDEIIAEALALGYISEKINENNESVYVITKKGKDYMYN